MGLSGIKAVLFDIDDTLFPSGEFAQRARKNAVRSMVEAGLAAKEGEAYLALRKIVRKKTSNYQYHLDDLCAKFGQGGNSKIIAAGIGAYHRTKEGIAPFPKVRQTLLTLRKAGYRVYAASEGKSLKQWDKLCRLGLHNLVQGAFISEEVGFEKGRKFYGKVARELHLPPSAILMVGDREEKDILPAREAGMRTARVCKKGAESKADICIRDVSGLLALLGAKGR